MKLPPFSSAAPSPWDFFDCTELWGPFLSWEHSPQSQTASKYSGTGIGGGLLSKKAWNGIFTRGIKRVLCLDTLRVNVLKNLQ